MQTNCLTEILFDSALERARELDAHLERTGKLLGPLHGLPISLKEQFDIKGVESTMGYVSRIGHVAVEDCEMVKMLMDLGAVVHCRTNIPQTLLVRHPSLVVLHKLTMRHIQSDETVNNVFGRTLNPCNTSLTAGGSSGGEAALLAMRGSIIGVGTVRRFLNAESRELMWVNAGSWRQYPQTSVVHRLVLTPANLEETPLSRREQHVSRGRAARVCAWSHGHLFVLDRHVHEGCRWSPALAVRRQVCRAPLVTPLATATTGKALHRYHGA